VRDEDEEEEHLHLHPGLYPLLLFLSKLRAPLTEEAVVAERDAARFLPALRKCGAMKVFQVRAMAARG
jgi:hypothetical protein